MKCDNCGQAAWLASGLCLVCAAKELTRLRAIVEPLEALLARGAKEVRINRVAEKPKYIGTTGAVYHVNFAFGPVMPHTKHTWRHTDADTLSEALSAAEKAKGASDEV